MGTVVGLVHLRQTAWLAVNLSSAPADRQFEENWQAVLAVLRERTVALTCPEILAAWPEDEERPAVSSLYRWLNLAVAQKLVRRDGAGSRGSPWRYRLETDADRYRDRGQLPPPLGW